MANYNRHFDELLAELNRRSDNIDKAYVEWLLRLHSTDPETSDGALFEVGQIANKYPQPFFTTFEIISDDLIDRVKKSDNYRYNWYHLAMLDGLEQIQLPELIPHTRSLLQKEIYSPHSEARICAVHALGTLGKAGDKESRKILWDARNTYFADPEETKQFQTAIDQALHKAK